MSGRPPGIRRSRPLLVASMLVVLALALVACGGSGDAKRSESAKPVDRRAGWVTMDVAMRFENLSERDLWIDWQGSGSCYTSSCTYSWETPTSSMWHRNYEQKYIYGFPFRIILENNNGVKKYVEVDASNPPFQRPDVTVNGERFDFGFTKADNAHTWTGDGWKLEVKRLEDNATADTKTFEAKFSR